MTDVSVIIVTYNRSVLLERAIESVLAQTYSDFEIIIVDDGSTDNTPDVAKRYGDKVRYLRQDHAGLPAGRNLGIKDAKGRWVALLDDDDLWYKDKLSRQVERIRDLPEPAFVCCNGTRNGVPIRNPQDPSGFIESMREFRLPPSSWLISRKVFERTGGFDESYDVGEDLAFLWKAYTRGVKVYYMSDLLVTWNYTEDSMSYGAQKRLNCQERLLKEFGPFIEKDRRYYSRCLYSLGKDAFRLGDAARARKYFLKAFFLEPWKLSYLMKYLRVRA